MKAGDPVPDLRVVPDRFLPHRYAGASGDFNPIHVDPESAKALGQPSNILHGLYMMSLMARAVADVADGDPRRLRRLSVEFRSPGFPEKELSVQGQVGGVEKKVAHVEAKVVQDGGDVVRGRAELSASP
jgi:acyl dehydratase